MLAGKQTDMVIGVDIHWEMVPAPPAPPIPTPLPNPFVGMVFDPAGLVVGLAIGNVIGALTGSPPTGPVLVNMLPAANTGTEAMGFGHILIPPGVSWAPMPSVMPLVIPAQPPAEPDNPACPDDDAILVTGSKTVHVMGANFCRLGDMAMSCSEPVRLPSSVLLAVPKGMPVLVGGPPTLDAMAAAGAFIRSQWVSHQFHNLVSYVRSARLRSLLHRAVCFLTGHPVDVASGRVFTDAVDFELPGPLPLRFERVYNSGFAGRSGPLGFGWSHSLDQRIWEERGKVVYLTEDGREVELDTFRFPGHRMAAGDETYYPIDRLTLKCLGEGRWEVWTHDGIGHELGPVAGRDPGVSMLLAKKTRDGHRVELHYDDRGFLSWVRDSGGRQLRFVSDDAGRLTSIKLPLPKDDGHFEHTRFTYDEQGDLVRVTDPLGHHWELEYSGHLLTRETDREGLSFYFGYDGIGQDAFCVRTWGDGGIYDHEILYDKQNKVTLVTNSLGHVTTYKMDLLGCVTEIIDPHGASTKYEYDARSLQRTAEIDVLGGATRYEYDDRGNRLRVEDPTGAVTTFEPHPRFDGPVRATDPNGGVWQWDYDAFGRLKGSANPFGHWTRYEYAEGRLVSATTPGGARTELGYDASGNLAHVINPVGGETRFEHDRLGRLVKLVNARGGVERRLIDLAGNLLEVHLPHGVGRRFEYDRERNVTRAVDSLRDIAFGYTGYHRLHERREAGTTVRFHYDTEDQLVAVENEAGELYRFTLDARGLVHEETGFDDFTRRYTRDRAGRVTRVDKPSGRVDELTYDAAGRITDVRHSDGTFERYRYRADGALIEASNDTAEVHFERDEMGRIVRERTRLADGSEHWVRSGYGPDGHRVRVESSDGHMHHIERNAAGDVTRVELEGQRWWVDFERDPLGLELSRTFPSGVTSRWDRDQVGRPMKRTVTFRGEKTLDEKRYVWEGDDQIRAILDPQHGDAHYKHDTRGRLVWAKLPWGEEQHRAMDAVGNIYRSPRLDDRRYGKGGRIEEADGTKYRHDEDGNLIEKTDVLGDMTRYRWNGAGMLEAVELPDGREVSFEYDVLARRVGKVATAWENGKRRVIRELRWSWDGHHPLAELDHEASKGVWIFDPGKFAPIAAVTRSTVWGICGDAQGAATEFIAADGSLAWQGGVTPLGEIEQLPSDLNLTMPGWPGQWIDTDCGLNYSRWRWFDPSSSQFISTDPLRIEGGLRPFAYPTDPLQFADPLGLSWEPHNPAHNDYISKGVHFVTDTGVELAARPDHAGGVSFHPVFNPATAAERRASEAAVEAATERFYESPAWRRALLRAAERATETLAGTHGAPGRSFETRMLAIAIRRVEQFVADLAGILGVRRRADRRRAGGCT